MLGCRWCGSYGLDGVREVFPEEVALTLRLEVERTREGKEREQCPEVRKYSEGSRGRKEVRG